MCKEKKNSIYDQYHIHHICLNTINVILVAINSNIIVGHLQDIDRKMMPFTPCQFHSLLSVLSFPSLLDIFFIMLTTSTNKKPTKICGILVHIVLRTSSNLLRLCYCYLKCNVYTVVVDENRERILW